MAGEADEVGEPRPSPRRACEPAPLPGGVALVPACARPRPWDWPVLEGLGVWGDLELPLDGEIFWALGVLLEGWLVGVLLFDTLFWNTTKTTNPLIKYPTKKNQIT